MENHKKLLKRISDLKTKQNELLRMALVADINPEIVKKIDDILATI